MQIFFDLDGVLADFDKKVIELLGKHPRDIPDKIMWPELAKPQYDFFYSLDPMSGMEVWDYCINYDRKVLTGMPRGNWAEEQKRRWCADVLGKETEVITCMSRDKALYCSPGDILIDDRYEQHFQNWSAAGGVFIHFQNNPDEIIDELKFLGI